MLLQPSRVRLPKAGRSGQTAAVQELEQVQAALNAQPRRSPPVRRERDAAPIGAEHVLRRRHGELPGNTAG